MRIIINKGHREHADGEVEIVAFFALIHDVGQGDETVFSGAMTEDEVTAMIKELRERKQEVWS